jgi:prepilin-type N-terminal cleavage/methylation domain-containing protein
MTCRSTSCRRGFSLVELLMAIFILGIGIISIASLFPAGIAQQQAAMNDQVGPLVARNAMALLRSKIPRGSFGHVELNSVNSPDWAGWDIRPGDWPWLRPSVVVTSDADDPLRGAIDIFDTADDFNGGITTVGEKDRTDDLWITSALSGYDGIPYRDHLRPAAEQIVPLVVIEQAERQYPREDGTGQVPRYYWDCMFRRSGGKVFAAIFVYRVNNFSGPGPTWTCQPADGQQLQTPWMLDLEDGANAYDPWRIGQGNGDIGDLDQWVLPNANAGDPYDPMELDDCWQCPGQWLIDQNGGIHQVVSGRTRKDDPTTHVRLSRAVPPLASDSIHIPDSSNASYSTTSDNRVPATGSLIMPGVSGTAGQQADAWSDSECFYHAGMLVRDLDGGADQLTGAPAVSRLWYMPSELVDPDTGAAWGVQPIYILVEEF